MCPSLYGARFHAVIEMKTAWCTSEEEEGAMGLTLKEAREWFQIRDNVKDAVLHLEVCDSCLRVRDLENLVQIGNTYRCRPGDKDGCLK